MSNDNDVKVNQKLQDLGTAYGAFDATKRKIEWAYRCAFVAFCAFLFAGFAVYFGVIADTPPWLDAANALLFWFVALVIAVGAFGKKAGKRG